MQSNSIKVNCDKNNLKKLRSFLSDSLHGFTVNEQDLSLVILAVDEICSNIIIHANHCNPENYLELDVSLEGGDVIIQIKDKGELFDYRAYNEPEMEALVSEKKKGSLGLMLVRRIMDTVEFKKTGGINICTMVKSVK